MDTRIAWIGCMLGLGAASASGGHAHDDGPRGFGGGHFDLAGLTSYDGLGAPANVPIFLDIGAGSHVHGIGLELLAETFGGSWLADLSIRFSVSDGSAVTFDLFSGQTGAGSDWFSTGGIVVTYNGPPHVDLIAGSDGLMRVELYETTVDAPGEAEAVLLAGSSVNFQFWVPAPGAMGVLGAGLLIAGRRRSAV